MSPPPTVTLTDTVGIEGSLGVSVNGLSFLANDVGTQSAVVALLTRSAVDTWRPTPSPNGQLLLACRTPLGEHDSDTGKTHMSVWTFQKDGSHEHLELSMGSAVAVDGGWTQFDHPEWSPNGTRLVMAAETTTTCQIVQVTTSGFGS